MRRCLFLLAALLLFAAFAKASDVIGLKITAFGVEGAYRKQQGATLFRIEAINKSGQAQLTTIRVYQADLSAFARPAWFSYIRTVNLAPAGVQIFDVPLQLANAENSVLYAEAVDRNGVPLGHASQRPGHATDGTVLGLICATDEVCKTIREKILFSGTAEEQTRKAQDLRLIQLKRIPPHWWAYVPIDTIVLAAPTKDFQREELDGLEAFVLQGGRLVLAKKEIGTSPGAWPNFTGAESVEAKASLAPFGSGSLVRVGSVSDAEFSNFFRSYGFAVSTPKDLEKQFERYREPVLTQPRVDMVSWLQRKTATHFRFPGPLKLILWMAAYLILMIVFSFLLPRRFGKPEVAWLTTPALAILFAGILYKVSAENRPVEYRLEESRYYQMDGASTLAVAGSEVQISSPHKGAVHLVAPGEFLYRPPQANGYISFESEPASSVGGEITLGDSWETNVFLRVWSSKSLSFQFIHRFPGSVTQTDDTQLVNSTGVNFEEAIVVTRDLVYLLGPLSAGASADLGKAKQIMYEDATGHRGNLLGTPPFAFGQNKQQGTEWDAFDGSTADTSSDSTSLETIIRGWPSDGDRIFFQTKAVFFGRGEDVTRPARLENVPAKQKSTALYCVTFREWK